MSRTSGIVTSSLLISLLMTSYGCRNVTEEAGEALKAAICSGKGAVLFEDVAYALEVLDIKYQTLCVKVDTVEPGSVKLDW